MDPSFIATKRLKEPNVKIVAYIARFDRVQRRLIISDSIIQHGKNNKEEMLPLTTPSHQNNQ